MRLRFTRSHRRPARSPPVPPRSPNSLVAATPRHGAATGHGQRRRPARGRSRRGDACARAEARPTRRSRPCSRSTSSSRKARASAAAATWSIRRTARRAGDVRRARDRAARGDRHLVLQGRQADGAMSDAIPGGKSVGVPGNLRMMAMAHQRYGKLPWAAIVPAGDPACARRVPDHAAALRRARRQPPHGRPVGRKAARSSTRPTAIRKPVGDLGQEPGVRRLPRRHRRARGRKLSTPAPNAQNDRRHGQRRAAQSVADDGGRHRHLQGRSSARRCAAPTAATASAAWARRLRAASPCSRS